MFRGIMLTRILTVVGVCLTMASVFAQPETSSRGRTVFETRCATCHGLDAHGGTAPNIARGSAAASYADDRLRRIIRDGLPAGMPGVGSSVPAADLTALVQHLRQLQRGGNNDAAEAPIAGDAALGRALFFGKADCAQCHSAEGRGGFLGSDLARTRLNPQALRQAIVHPEPSTKGTLVTITLRDGARKTGLVRNEDNFSLQLQDERGAFHSIDKASIANRSRDARPLMPTDYAQRLSDADIQNLIRYITQLAPTQPKP
jgi:cytochrome c oxidase cbb3-type subunit 3